MNAEISALITICAWYCASAMLIIWGIYKYMSNDEVKQLAHQVAVVMQYAKQSNLFLETLKAELQDAQPVAGTGNAPPKSAIELAYNRRKDDPTQTEQK